jgi:cystathionine gamma-synthase
MATPRSDAGDAAATIAARAGFPDEPHTGALVPPIQLATTYARDRDYALIGGRDYTRDRNPTPEPVERTLAQLEGGADALAFASGMAAATAVFRAVCRPGDHVVVPAVGYFALRAWITRFGAELGIDVSIVDATAIDELRGALRPGKTRLLWLESPANPTWGVTDLAAAAAAGRAAGALVCVDSTCATPVHTRPLALGADVVMHSATKYLGGHGDVLAGALVVGADGVESAAWQAIRRHRHDDGACLGPFEAFLLLRGIRTLYVRVPRQSATALGLARRLAANLGVDVLYPGLPSHPQHELAARQMHGGFGGMLSIRTGGGAATALGVASRLRLITRATSLGGVETLIEHRATVEGPGSPSPPDLLRISVGLEDEDDLYADLAAALAVR